MHQRKNRSNRAAAPGASLADLAPGTLAVVVAIENTPGEKLLPVKLAAFGIVAGAQVELRQKRPLPVVRIGHTEVALDLRIARLILASPIRREGLAGNAAHKIR